ncbi:6655_t:CDS:1, partial [Acaulospora colombiana]
MSNPVEASMERPRKRQKTINGVKFPMKNGNLQGQKSNGVSNGRANASSGKQNALAKSREALPIWP